MAHAREAAAIAATRARARVVPTDVQALARVVDVQADPVGKRAAIVPLARQFPIGPARMRRSQPS